jgi:putative sigma-54 modulation protein
VGRLERIIDDRSDAIFELSVEPHHRADDSRIVDLTLVVGGQTIRGRAAGPTHRAGIDEVIDKVERRAVDSREKPRSKRLEGREDASAAGPRASDTTASPGEETADEGSPSRVTKVKRFAIEPMFEEDAVARMEELGHSFFVFVDAETERIAILYRRGTGDYGLIEPVVGGAYTAGGPPGSGSRGASGARAGRPGVRR